MSPCVTLWNTPGRARRQGVIHVVRIALRARPLLVHQSLHSGHHRRCHGSAAESGPIAGSSPARRSAIVRVGKANDRIVSPDGAVRREHGNVGDIAHAVIGDAGDSGLPRRLGVSLTAAVGNPEGAGAPVAQLLGPPLPAATTRRPLCRADAAVAKTARTIARRITNIAGEQAARARVVPRNFRDIRQRRAVGCGVGRGSNICWWCHSAHRRSRFLPRQRCRAWKRWR